ncbi:MAG: sigma-70 family RNA polymerase sigma factor [Limisphaerales bacterium]
MEPDIQDLIPTRQSLLSRLSHWDDHASWQRFFDTYWKLIYSVAIHAGLTDAEAQDVVQETVISVSKSMPTFHYDPATGSFKTWLLNLTRWRIADQMRKRPKTVSLPIASWNDDTARTVPIDQIPDPNGNGLESLWEEEWRKNLIDAAMQRVKCRVDPQHYQLFDLYVVKGLPVRKVCRLFQVSVGRVYLVKHRINHLIRKEIQRLEASGV